MAAPSKKDKELRKKIIDLNIFKRDSIVYTLFENFDKENNWHLSDSFSFECLYRHDDNLYCNHKSQILANIFDSTKEKYTGLDGYHGKPEDFINFLNEDSLTKDEDILNKYTLLDSINQNIASYFLKTLEGTFIHYSKSIIDNNDYLVHNNIKINPILKSVLTPQRYEYFRTNLGYRFNLGIKQMLQESQSIEKPLTTDERKKILKKISESNYRVDKTTIRAKSSALSILTLPNNNRNKNVDIELNLSKSKEEIIKYISKIKDDFDENPSNFKNIYEILGDIVEPFIVNPATDEVYKSTRSPKPNAGRLADKLFIYDCKKINKIFDADILTKEYIEDEINKYWRKTKNISTDRFHSIDKYHKTIENIIDKKQFYEYLTGIENSQK
jgi:hypothetical protein